MTMFERWHLPQSNYSNRKITPEAIVIHSLHAGGYYPDDPYSPENVWETLRLEVVSAHYIVARDGTIIECVPECYRAWHAGLSEYAGRKNWNDFAIGIELIGDCRKPEEGFADEQYFSCRWLVDYYRARYSIQEDMIVGHEQIAPGRKVDPGIATGAFDMSRIIDQVLLD